MKSSICLTIHNKESILKEVLDRIYAHTDWKWSEFICVLDGCTDSSEEILLNAMRENSSKKIKTSVVYTNNVFETKANNAAIKKSSAEFVIIVQDDMLINEANWNNRLLEPFYKFSDVFAVTARCAHNWSFCENSKDIHETETDLNKWSDIIIHLDHADKNIIGFDRSTFYVRDCANRGPLAINREDLVRLNYLDEIYSPQEMDDHDIALRAKKELNKVCGFYHIDWIESKGSTRDENGNTKRWLFNANQKNVKIFYSRHKEAIKNRTSENRTLK